MAQASWCSNANLSGESLDDVGLGGANFTQAVLTGVDLTKSRTDVGSGEVAYVILQAVRFP
ncbi:pentapeptide repeat-containing protein [Streptomyces mirabilis]|uniref:pentapeptide repeat-containing protein n=1 Tax=Streptomyces TaxID=1883 RepID=UPI000BB111E6